MTKNNFLDKHKHIKKINVRYDDLDTHGHVNNKSYLTYLEEAVLDFHNTLFPWKIDSQFCMVIARIEINYIKPVFYGDNLELHTKVSNVGNKSFTLETHFVVNKNKETTVVSESKVVLLFVDIKSGNTIAISEREKKILLSQ